MKLTGIIFFVLLCCCILLIIAFNNMAVLPQAGAASSVTAFQKNPETPPLIISEITLPKGYKRATVSDGSFAEWIRNIPLRKDNTVYLYNGNPKPNQNLHYAVLDFSTGKKDLQQCADAIMRLKAEYYFSKNEYSKISFKATNKTFNFQQWLNNIDSPEEDYHVLLLQFMEEVFISCGTYTVDAMTTNIAMAAMQPGDLFVKAGAPGHAMMVADVAVNETTGEKVYLLAQSFMPAQDMHIVINPVNSEISPWYAVNKKEIVTPGWTFAPNNFKRFK